MIGIYTKTRESPLMRLKENNSLISDNLALKKVNPKYLLNTIRKAGKEANKLKNINNPELN